MILENKIYDVIAVFLTLRTDYNMIKKTNLLYLQQKRKYEKICSTY